MRILVLRGGALGDFIVTLPALALLRQRWPGASITLVGNARAAELARARGLVDVVYSQHEGRWRLLFGVEKPPAEMLAWLGDFDLVVNYWPDPDGALARKFPVRDGQRFLSASAMPTRAPAAAHYCEPLRELGLEPKTRWFPLFPVAASVSEWTRTNPPLAHARGYVAIHPGSGSPRKNWPAERWRELISQLHSPISLILGEAELERADTSSLLAWTKTQPAVQTLLNPALEDLVDHFHHCRLFLGHDSGVSHLAAACGAPCVLLFGPTDAAVWAPPAPNVRVLQAGPDLRSIPLAEVRAAAVAALGDQT